jgi:hypothetical protein
LHRRAAVTEIRAISRSTDWWFYSPGGTGNAELNGVRKPPHRRGGSIENRAGRTPAATRGDHVNDDTKIAEIIRAMQEWQPGPDRSTNGLKKLVTRLVTRYFPDATLDQIQEAIRDWTRKMPLAKRVREFEFLIACIIEECEERSVPLGEMISVEEFAILVAAFHLVVTADDEYSDALLLQ